MDSDAWDAESERLDALWKTAYRLAFVDYALGRPGWEREHAEDWAENIVEDALIVLRSYAPEEAAKIDVEQIELECD
jgi:hypothetical protein